VSRPSPLKQFENSGQVFFYKDILTSDASELKLLEPIDSLSDEYKLSRGNNWAHSGGFHIIN
jgi:hypothetical protein